MTDWLPLGTTRYAIDGDTLFWKVSGELTREDARAYTKLIADLHKKWGYALLFADSTAGVSMSSATRHQFLEGSPDRPTPSHVIIVGVSPKIRALAFMVAGVTKLLFKRQFGMDFVDTEAAGLLRLAEVRKATRKALGLAALKVTGD